MSDRRCRHASLLVVLARLVKLGDRGTSTGRTSKWVVEVEVMGMAYAVNFMDIERVYRKRNNSWVISYSISYLHHGEARRSATKNLRFNVEKYRPSAWRRHLRNARDSELEADT